MIIIIRIIPKNRKAYQNLDSKRPDGLTLKP